MGGRQGFLVLEKQGAGGKFSFNGKGKIIILKPARKFSIFHSTTLF